MNVLHLFTRCNSDTEISQFMFGSGTSGSQPLKCVLFFLASFLDLYSEKFDFFLFLNGLDCLQCGHFYKGYNLIDKSNL